MEAVATAAPKVKKRTRKKAHINIRVKTSQGPTSVCVSRLCELQDGVVLAVRQEYVPIGDQVLTLGDGDEVAVVPPLSGG